MLEPIRRLGIRDKKFSEVTRGEEIPISNSSSQNIVVIDAAPISRSYYENNYDPDKLTVPTCWSSDTQIPSVKVPEEQRQATRCLDCKQNIRGSGYGSSRACRFSQRLAITMEDHLEIIYQLRLPATSIFGETRDGNMPLQSYARFLTEHNTSAIAVVTQIYFDTNSETPKLFFKPIRPLREEELQVVSKMKAHPNTVDAITLDFTPPLEGMKTSPFGITDGFQLNKQEKSYG